MLGMMNSAVGTDGVEFYSASTRAAAGTCANGGSSQGADAAMQDKMRVFVEVKQKPQITYTKDGRKMIGGKVLSDPNSPSTPNNMWDSLLRSKITTNIRPSTSEPGESAASPQSHTDEGANRESGIEEPAPIQPTTAITVASGNPSAMGSIRKAGKKEGSVRDPVNEESNSSFSRLSS